MRLKASIPILVISTKYLLDVFLARSPFNSEDFEPRRSQFVKPIAREWDRALVRSYAPRFKGKMIGKRYPLKPRAYHCKDTVPVKLVIDPISKRPAWIIPVIWVMAGHGDHLVKRRLLSSPAQPHAIWENKTDVDIDAQWERTRNLDICGTPKYQVKKTPLTNPTIDPAMTYWEFKECWKAGDSVDWTQAPYPYDSDPELEEYMREEFGPYPGEEIDLKTGDFSGDVFQITFRKPEPHPDTDFLTGFLDRVRAEKVAGAPVQQQPPRTALIRLDKNSPSPHKASANFTENTTTVAGTSVPKRKSPDDGDGGTSGVDERSVRPRLTEDTATAVGTSVSKRKGPGNEDSGTSGLDERSVRPRLTEDKTTAVGTSVSKRKSPDGGDNGTSGTDKRIVRPRLLLPGMDVPSFGIRRCETAAPGTVGPPSSAPQCETATPGTAKQSLEACQPRTPAPKSALPTSGAYQARRPATPIIKAKRTLQSLPGKRSEFSALTKSNTEINTGEPRTRNDIMLLNRKLETSYPPKRTETSKGRHITWDATLAYVKQLEHEDSESPEEPPRKVRSRKRRLGAEGVEARHTRSNPSILEKMPGAIPEIGEGPSLTSDSQPAEGEEPKPTSSKKRKPNPKPEANVDREATVEAEEMGSEIPAKPAPPSRIPSRRGVSNTPLRKSGSSVGAVAERSRRNTRSAQPRQ
ncbi:hypothetical protein FGG08_006378 [Glutinoglossum americanum]|uniref:Uncharacterized protein n=1 Tax=Glutinoglossum americanum TaxID=1670608 RepID=A0A9P8L1Z4_9PEZI|nr:hypothetical protein FGG08_006378 [Glutinoglossum americanum]